MDWFDDVADLNVRAKIEREYRAHQAGVDGAMMRALKIYSDYQHREWRDQCRAIMAERWPELGRLLGTQTSITQHLSQRTHRWNTVYAYRWGDTSQREYAIDWSTETPSSVTKIQEDLDQLVRVWIRVAAGKYGGVATWTRRLRFAECQIILPEAAVV